MKPAIYLRVSTPDQSLESQRTEIAAYCAYRGWPNVPEFTDVMSGSKSDRPGLDAMLAAVDRGEVDMVIVVKLDRLGRSLRHVIGLIAQFEKKGVSLVCTSQGIDTTNSNPMGKMQLGILAVFADFERELIRERTRAGLRVARANGKVLGRCSPTLLPEPERSAVIAEWVAGGATGLRGLAERLGGVSTATARAKYAEWRLAQSAP